VEVVDNKGMGMPGAYPWQIRVVGRQVRVGIGKHRLVVNGPDTQDCRQTDRADGGEWERRDR
jgi:hypothetical protein